MTSHIDTQIIDAIVELLDMDDGQLHHPRHPY